ncbi:unnamed protein product [Rhizoctonia solani]|uniref:Pirin C-terminal domain-containing protein n=1 Tax=Rhizoctonia solani TaxID=456999 RepID=A0A8H3ALC4_9AGAM|nr:unnamed protein product [Rhizoctonia solani]
MECVAPRLCFRPLLQLDSISTYTMTERGLSATQAQEDFEATSRHAVRVVKALATPEGSGATVWRTIGGPELENLDPFLMLDHFVADHHGAAFPGDYARDDPIYVHPQTQAFRSPSQRTSNGHLHATGFIPTRGLNGEPWDIVCWGCTMDDCRSWRQVIIKHAEMPVYQEGADVPIGLQLWVNLPSQYKMNAPSYKDIKSETIPTVFREHGDIEIRIISGASCGTSVAPPSIGGCWYIHIKFHKRRSVFNQELPPGWTGFVYILRGSLSIHSEIFSSHTAVILSSDPKENHVSLSAREDETDVVLFAAEPLNQPIARFGPFVMNTKEELQKALLDYRMEINGFENARKWKSSIGGR